MIYEIKNKYVMTVENNYKYVMIVENNFKYSDDNER